MKYLKFMPYVSVESASRNKRELAAAKEVGYETFCYSSDRTPPEIVKNEGFTLICDQTPEVTREIKPKLRRWFKLLANCFRYKKVVRTLNPDIISGHNSKSLAIAYGMYFFTPKKNKPLFIYDSHEVELRKKTRGKVAFTLTKWVEGFLIKRVAFTIIPCDDPADFLQETYSLKQRPVVIRSVPEYWNIDTKKTEARRSEFIKALNAPENSFLTIYTGLLVPTRGLEDVIDAMEFDKDMYSIWVGEPNGFLEGYEEKLLKSAEEKGVRNRLLRIPLVPQNTLWEYVGAADVAIIVMDYTKNANYLTALPNKFFEAIQSMTPVICADSVEMKRIVEKYNIGSLVPAADGKSLAAAVKAMRENKGIYESYKKGLATAKKELCWEEEKSILKDAFNKYLK